MLKHNIARIFCLMTVFLLSGNVVLSSVPAQYNFEDLSKEKETRISAAVDAGQYTFLAEEDPFEEVEILFTIPEVFSFVFFRTVQVTEQNQLYALTSPAFRTVPRWLLVRHIII
jgi:hypothetical protein